MIRLVILVSVAVGALGLQPALAGPRAPAETRAVGPVSPRLAASKPKPPPPPSSTPKKPAWVALVHAVGDVPPAWVGKLARAAQSVPDRDWVDAPAISLDDAALTLGCASWGPACAGQVADMTGAANAVIIEARRAAGSAVVALAIAGVAADGSAVPLSGADSPDERLEVSVDDDGLKLAQAWVTGAIKGLRPTALVVTSDLDGTEVVVDNVPAGKTPLTVLDIAAGPHALLLRREGRAPLSRTIDVKAGVINREHGVLSASGPRPPVTPAVGTPVAGVTPASPAPSGGGSMAVVGWGLTGVGAATAVGGAVLGSLSTGEYYGLLDENGHTRLELCETGGGFAPSGDARCAKELAPDERDRVTILAFQNQLLSQATVAFVVGGVGLLVAATGAALALTAGGEAADDSAASAAR